MKWTRPCAGEVVQEAYVRAWKCFGSFHGGESCPWLLTIVRHTCYSWLQHNRAHDLATVFEEEIHSVASESANPETLLLHRANQQMLRDALEALPVAFARSWCCVSWRGCRTKRWPPCPRSRWGPSCHA